MAENPEHYAIVIGIDQYPQLGNVSGGVRSAASFVEWLSSAEGGGLPESNIYYIWSPPELSADPLDARPIPADVDRAFVKFGAVKEDRIGKRLYFYFAGRACGTSLDDVTLLMADASLKRLGSNVGLSRYRQFLSQSTLFEEVVYILDCAFLETQLRSEPAGPSLTLPPTSQSTSVKEFIIMSSPKRGTATGPDAAQDDAYPGLLTKAVLEGLRGAAATSAGTAESLVGVVTAASLGECVRGRVRDLAPGPKLLQLPEMLLPSEEMIFATVAVSLLSGTLIVQVPHWSAEIRVYNNLLQLVTGPLKIQASHEAPDIYQAEIRLPEGIYKIEVTLEGQAESQYVGIQYNKTGTIEKDSWQHLKFSSAAPLAGTATTHEWHSNPAVEWSKKLTWVDSPGGAKRTSRLFLFVRTTEPERYASYAEGLKLLDAAGELVTDFSGGVEKDPQYGWMAFCADLAPGCYVLRRGRAGVRLRQQPVYLCEGWETQVFLQATASPSLRTQSLNMARKGMGFKPDDAAAVAAEAVLDSFRYGGNIQHLVTKEKLSSLLAGKFENPWLGILAAYALRTQLEGQTGDPDQESQHLLTHVMSFLGQIGDHPDVRALKLNPDETAPEPFPYPPMLIKGLRIVQGHARRFAGTVPPQSLTDLVLDSLVVNSPWTAWRHLKANAFTLEGIDPVVVETGKKLARILAGKALNHAATVLQSASPKAPVLRVAEVIKDAGQKLSAPNANLSDIASFAVNALRDAPLLDAIQALMQQSDLDALPVSVTVNHEQKINDLLQGVKAEEVSQVTGLSVDHTESSLQRLRGSGAQAAAAKASGRDLELTPADKVVLEYALAESAKQGEASLQKPAELETLEGEAAADDAGDLPADFQPGQGSPGTIEDCVTAIRGEATRLLSEHGGAGATADAEVRAQAQTLADRLRKVADGLLDRAAFSVTTDERGHILYCNRAFIFLVTPTDDSLDPEQRQRKKKAHHRAWEKVLANFPPGQSALHNPIEGVTPEEFRLWRTVIRDEKSAKAKAYLNTMRGKDAAAVTQDTLQQIGELLPDLARYASFFSYDLSEGRKEHASKLEAVALKLEGIVNEGGAPPHP